MGNRRKLALCAAVMLLLSGCGNQPVPQQEDADSKEESVQAEITENQEPQPEDTTAESAQADANEDEKQFIDYAIEPLQEYWTNTTNVMTESDVHEYYVGIYNEFAQNAQIGRLNTNDGREQMKLLIGEIVSLEKAREWVEDYGGFFVSGAAPDHLSEDLMPAFKTLKTHYDNLSAEDRKRADELLTMDWNTGSFFIYNEDVAELAELIGVSEGTMVQFFGVMTSYGDIKLPDGTLAE